MSAGPVTVYYPDDDRLGWAPITHMVEMMVRLFGARFRPAGGLATPRLRQIRLALRRAPTSGDAVAIFIARRPVDIAGLACLPEFFAPHRARALWIVDSFRTEALPARRILDQFDLVAYTQAYDSSVYEGLAGDRALWLGWGSDVLDLGGAAAERPIDLLRVGRQPPAWDDDEATAAACAARGLSFQGRPPQSADPRDQQRALMQDFYGRSKYLVAHSNLAAPAHYTHREKEYVTGRWTDALASGTVVAGMPPVSDMALIDWPGATLAFDRIDLAHNIEALAEAVAGWRPQMAAENHLQALRRLDWRWRLASLAERLGLTPAPLVAEIARLTARIAALDAARTALETPR